MWRSGGNILIQMNLEMELILNLFFLDLINAVHYLIDGYDKSLLNDIHSLIIVFFLLGPLRHFVE